MFDHKFGFKPMFKILGFPFLFLWEMLPGGGNTGWGSDCANPISPYTPNALDHDVPLTLVIASVFGAMHFITWSFSMPTSTELWMWRSASIALTAAPIISLLCAAVVLAIADTGGTPTAVLVALVGAFALVFLALHPIIRFIVAIDSVVLLRDLPDTVFLVLSLSDAIPSL